MNQDFVQLKQRLHGLTADFLEQNHAVWHRTCYSEVTHKLHTERDRKRFERTLSAKDSNTLSSRKEKGRPTSSRTSPVCDNAPSLQCGDPSKRSLTRSHVNSFKRNLCFYCQDIKHDIKHARAGSIPEQVHVYRSSDIGKSIQNIVAASDNDLWKLNMTDIIAEGDFLSRDIQYHTSCHMKQWQQYVQQPQRCSASTRTCPSAEDTVNFISAEIEFTAELQERLDDGDIITMIDVTTLYRNMMYDHGIHDRKITRQVLLAKIKENINNFAITEGRGRKPAVIHSMEAGRSAIDQSTQERDLRGDIALPLFKDNQASD